MKPSFAGSALKLFRSAIGGWLSFLQQKGQIRAGLLSLRCALNIAFSVYAPAIRKYNMDFSSSRSVTCRTLAMSSTFSAVEAKRGRFCPVQCHVRFLCDKGPDRRVYALHHKCQEELDYWTAMFGVIHHVWHTSDQPREATFCRDLMSLVVNSIERNFHQQTSPFPHSIPYQFWSLFRKAGRR